MDEKKQDIWEQWTEETKQMKGYVLAELTDRYIVDKWPLEKTPKLLENHRSKVLEIRVFNKEREVKLFRGDIGREFRMRTLDEKGENVEYYDEEQFLDIDTKRSAKLFNDTYEVYATGGGRYHLPLTSMKDAKIVVRYHFGKYEDSGQARIEDWRAVELKEG